MSPAVLVSLLALFCSAAATAAALTAGLRMRTVSDALAAAAGGALVFVAVTHLLPEAAARIPHAPVLAGTGLAGAIAVHVLFRRAGARAAGAVLVLSGVTLHSFTDGLVLAVAGNAGADLLRSSAPGMLMHEIPEAAFCYFAARRAGIRPSGAAGVAVMVGGFATVAGAVLGDPLAARATEGQFGVLLALCAGLMLYSGGSILLEGSTGALWERSAAAGAGAAMIAVFVWLGPAHLHPPGAAFTGAHAGHGHPPCPAAWPDCMFEEALNRPGPGSTAYRFQPPADRQDSQTQRNRE